MFGTRKRIIIDVAILICLLAVGYVFRQPIFGFVRQQEQRFFPCRVPIKYSIGQFDTKFGITKAQLAADVTSAARIWESPIDKDLFEYSSSSIGSDLTINLIYDYRQKATDKQQKVDDVIDADRAKLDAMDAQYRAERASYESDIGALESRINAFNSKKAAYESDVAAANARGGASGAEYQELQQRQRSLESEAAQLKSDQTALNSKRDHLNATVATLNDMIKKLNLNINTYNTIGGSIGETFKEGEYINDITGSRINIYQFTDNNQLVRVMAHELGHAIGLDHNDDPQGIMYAYNQATNQKLTAADLAEIKSRCGLE